MVVIAAVVKEAGVDTGSLGTGVCANCWEIGGGKGRDGGGKLAGR